jgi:hypothetical protein
MPNIILTKYGWRAPLRREFPAPLSIPICQPNIASGIRSLFSRAAKRAGIEGGTLKDIRAKAVSDAAKQGYTTAGIEVALAHTDEATSCDYIRDQAVPVSAVVIKLPKG